MWMNLIVCSLVFEDQGKFSGMRGDCNCYLRRHTIWAMAAILLEL
jgi:hypothetical protein